MMCCFFCKFCGGGFIVLRVLLLQRGISARGRIDVQKEAWTAAVYHKKGARVREMLAIVPFGVAFSISCHLYLGIKCGSRTGSGGSIGSGSRSLFFACAIVNLGCSAPVGCGGGGGGGDGGKVGGDEARSISGGGRCSGLPKTILSSSSSSSSPWSERLTFSLPPSPSSLPASGNSIRTWETGLTLRFSPVPTPVIDVRLTDAA
ncbi:hypothetical protein BDZ88DRAFT_109849 [Geranomyces variabilis]|nr:hypothetical protein BDZ88DRAFT_109849 [Geranomyces variabilis]